MRKVLKWIGIILASLILLVILVAAGLSFRTSARLNKTYTIQPAVVSIPTDNASIEEGKRLTSIYCAGCHGDDLAGTEFFNDPAIGVVDSPNLTSGSGGVGGRYTDTDWVRAIRHGVDSQGKPLFIMPSKDFHYFSDEDLGQIIAFLKTAPSVGNESSDFSITPLGRILVGVGAFGNVINAETIDHETQPPTAPFPSVSNEYGGYLVQTFGCRTCHGEDLAGAKDPSPDAPQSPNLTSGGSLGSWSEQYFISIVRMRESEWMPYKSLKKMTDDELTAIFMYLQSIPSQEIAAK